jgi:3-deoxy-D-manno-octulosonic-acid transferase
MNQNDLADQLAQLMEQPEKIKEMGKAALAFSKQARGATDRALQLVKKYLPN